MAVWPDTETVSRLEGLPRPASRGVRWTDREHWHITLRFLGDADIEECRTGLDALAWPPAPGVELGPATHLLNPTVLALPASGLAALAATAGQLRISVEPEGRAAEPEGWAAAPEGRAARDRHPFRGHLTLARGRRPGDLGVADVAGYAFEADFIPGEVTLVSSARAPGPGPNRYQVVGAWSLYRP